MDPLGSTKSHSHYLNIGFTYAYESPPQADILPPAQRRVAHVCWGMTTLALRKDVPHMGLHGRPRFLPLRGVLLFGAYYPLCFLCPSSCAYSDVHFPFPGTLHDTENKKEKYTCSYIAYIHK